MRYRQLGHSGLEVSETGLGANRFGEAGYTDYRAVEPVIHAALDAGVNFIDTSNVYGGGASEEFIGRALRGRRAAVVVGTKFGSKRDHAPNRFGAGRRYIVEALEESLGRLQTEWIDLYMVHRPDPRTPLEETLGALDDVVRAGKVRYIGCCNFEAWRLVDALRVSEVGGKARFISSQFHYSMLNRAAESEMLPACRAHRVGVLPYLPLAAGMLTGKASGDSGDAPTGSRLETGWGSGAQWLTARNRRAVTELSEWAARHGRTVLELAFAWLLGEPLVASVIAGATSAEQVVQNARASSWRLALEERAEVDAILARHGIAPTPGYYSVADYFGAPVEVPQADG